MPVEALACGCNVVSSDLPAVRDIIKHEKTGLLVPPGKPAALATAIEKLLTDDELRLALSRAGREFVVDNYDWDHIATQYILILDQLIEMKI